MVTKFVFLMDGNVLTITKYINSPKDDYPIINTGILFS